LTSHLGVLGGLFFKRNMSRLANALWTCGSDVLSLSLTSSNQAFDTLVKLRKERVLAAEELCYIYFQVQVRAGLQYVLLESESVI
jgi:hypothetical protein